jgi:hypothetical protein
VRERGKKENNKAICAKPNEGGRERKKRSEKRKIKKKEIPTKTEREKREYKKSCCRYRSFFRECVHRMCMCVWCLTAQ